MLRFGFFDSEITGYDEEDMPIFDRAESSDFLAMFISRIISDGVLAQPGDCFQVVAYEGMVLKVRPGFGIIKGRFAMDLQEFEITVPDAPASYRRIDRVILRANYLDRCCEIIIREGETGANPIAPDLMRPASGDYYELCLATVSVSAKQTVISQANITDTRPNSAVCGFITQVIDHIDTSVFYAQFDQFYKEFEEQATGAYADWTKQYNQFYEQLIEKSDTAYGEWAAALDSYLQGLKDTGNSQVQSIINMLESFETNAEAEFREWYQHIKDTLDGNVAGNLQNQIDILTVQVNALEDMLLNGVVYTALATEDREELAAEDGEILEASWPICQCVDMAGNIRL